MLLHRSNPRGLDIALLNRRSDNRERDFRQLLSFGRQFPVISCRLLRHELSVSGGIMQSVGARLSWRPSTFARSLLFYALRRGHDPAVALFVPQKAASGLQTTVATPRGCERSVLWRSLGGQVVGLIRDFSSDSRKNCMSRLTVVA